MKTDYRQQRGDESMTNYEIALKENCDQAATIARLERELAEAKRYATTLAVSLAKKFPAISEWKPLEDVFWLLMQIDNMCVGFMKKAEALDALAAVAEGHVVTLEVCFQNKWWASLVISGGRQSLPNGTGTDLAAAIMDALEKAKQ